MQLVFGSRQPDVALQQRLKWNQPSRTPSRSRTGQLQVLRARRLSASGPTDLQLARLRGGDSTSLAGSPQAEGFLAKLRAAWRIFFPERAPALSPKEEGKNRLRMILVADRCGITAESLSGMRESIVRAVSTYVDIETDEEIEVNLSTDPELGTIYSVAVPVKRVKKRGLPEDMVAETVTNLGKWDPNDPTSDPSDQFPFGA